MEQEIKDYINQLPELNKLNYEIITCQKGHEGIPEIKDNKMGIYIYAYKGKYLKIGKAWTNSSARWIYQHYNYNSSKSNLASSIINDKDFCKENNLKKVTKDNKEDREYIRTWLKTNTQRINIIIERSNNSKRDLFYLNLMESWLHYKCNPKYEGHKYN